MDKIWDNYKEIKVELEQIVRLMKKETKCRDKVIESSILELIESGGKMLRPAFVVIGSRFGEHNEERVRALGAVLELFHMATLVHDDVIDNSKLRRGNETIQSKYGKDYAVYIGDFLFCVCFKILASNASLASIKMDSRAMSRICMGEVEQLNSRFSNNLSVKNYLSRISGKTAELFSLSLYLGAAESGCSDKLAKELWKIGHNIGMAFQIIDDILDYVGDDKSIKKSAANDLKQGIFTLPFIYAYKKEKNVFDKYLNSKSISDNDVQDIIKLVKEHDGVLKAMDLAKKYTDKAFKGIDRLPENEYKFILRDIAKMLILREY
ncbi:polyprenyl synthetase family protein [Clostridium paraputrificum]|uniref:polyprenyl synthetase family protein n=1 Tax=Clostridium TaxID=1485 RepID=UPI003D335D15